MSGLPLALKTPEPRTPRSRSVAPPPPKKEKGKFVPLLSVIEEEEELAEDAATQPLGDTKRTSSFTLNLDPVDDALGPFYPVSLPFISSVPLDAPQIIDMGVWTDDKGRAWVVLVSDLFRCGQDDLATEERVIYKLYNLYQAQESKMAWLKGLEKTRQFTYKRK